MNPAPFRVVTVDQHPALRAQNSRMSTVAWPEFMLHDPVAAYFPASTAAST